MKALTILTLAVTALVPTALAAQTVSPPEPWSDVPKARLNGVPATVPAADTTSPRAAPAAPPGVTWQQEMPAPVMSVAPVASPQPKLSQAASVAATHPVAPVPSTASAQNADRHRLERGAQLPPGWFTPRFQVRNGSLYGFPPPYPGLQWIRYYDDALLIDREGWVHDSRHDVDWDGHGEQWNYERGVPEYVDLGDDGPGAGSYTHYESYQGPYPVPAYGYGNGFYYIPVTITETTTVRGVAPQRNAAGRAGS